MIHATKLNEKTRELLSFSPLQYMLDTVTEQPHFAEVYADDEDDPTCCALLFGHYLFLDGEVGERFIADLTATVFNEERRRKLGMVIAFYESNAIAGLLKNHFKKVFDRGRCLYKYRASEERENKTARIVRIDKALLASGAANLEMITEEVLGTATYEDMEDFCNKGIGYTYVKDDRISAFCTSEYPSKASVAIGIEVEKKYQEQGIAAEMTMAFVKEAANHYQNVFWECWNDNTPSIKTALKCGFEKVADYPVLIVALD